jgi:hypothetical protein
VLLGFGQAAGSLKLPALVEDFRGGGHGDILMKPDRAERDHERFEINQRWRYNRTFWAFYRYADGGAAWQEVK